MEQKQGFYKKGQRKRKKSQRASSSGSEVSPVICKRQKEPDRNPSPKYREGDTNTMGDMETRIISKIEIKIQQKTKKMKDETVSELKHFLEKKFQDLDLKMTKQVKELEEKIESRMFVLEEKNTELEETVTLMQQENKKLKDEMRNIKLEVRTVKNHAVTNEQYSRKNNIKIFGMKEEQNEDCVQKVIELAREKLKVELTTSQVEVAHRTRSQRKPQPIIVRFNNHTTKMQVLRNRSKLKGVGVSMAEDLCRDLMTVYNRVKEDQRVVSTWAWNGKVFVKDRRGKTYSVQYGQNLDDLLQDVAETQGDMQIDGEDTK